MKAVAQIGLDEQFYNMYNALAKNVFQNGGKFTKLDDTIRSYFVDKARVGDLQNISSNVDWLCKMGELTSLCTMYVAKEDGSYDSCLCTISVTVIKTMVQKGMIVEGSVDRAIKALSDGKRITKAGNANEIFAIRFDLVESGNVPKYKIVVPTKTFKSDLCTVLPLLCHYIVEGGIMGYTSKSILQITSESNGIQRNRMMTTNASLLKKVYRDDNVVKQKMQYGNIGFNVSDLRIHGYDVQATAETVRTTSFSLYTFIDASIPKRIDVGLADQNDDFIRIYFKRCIEKVIKSNSQAVLMQIMGDMRITFKDITTATGALKLSVIIAKANQYSAYDLFMIMQKYPSVFGDTKAIRVGVKDIEKNAVTMNVASEPQYLSTMNPEMAVEKFKEMLSKGAVKVIYKTKGSGNATNLTLTNNFKILQKAYGEDYIARYESKGKMKAYAKKMIENMREGFYTASDIDKILKITGVDTLFASPITADRHHATEYKNAALSSIEAIEVRASKRSLSPTEVTAHSLVAAPKMANGEVSGDYYKTLDVTRILECSYFKI